MMAQRANGRYWLAPGTAINAVLLNAVNTLLPGALTARVTQNIYDSRYGTHLVIPSGSILRGRYDSSVQDGQNRVLMAFDTLVTPSGGVVNLGNMGASDALGRAGMQGDLHTHFWERIGISTLLALEAVGMDRLSPNQSSASFGGTTTSPATNGAQIIVNTANQELQRRYSVKPNITIDAGQPLTIVTTGSIEVPLIANTR
jgi:type IV secretion system protein VirB10